MEIFHFDEEEHANVLVCVPLVGNPFNLTTSVMAMRDNIRSDYGIHSLVFGRYRIIYIGLWTNSEASPGGKYGMQYLR